MKVRDLRAFVPARDFELSRRFYADLGFTEKWCGDKVAEFEAAGRPTLGPSRVVHRGSHWRALAHRR